MVRPPILLALALFSLCYCFRLGPGRCVAPNHFGAVDDWHRDDGQALHFVGVDGVLEVKATKNPIKGFLIFGENIYFANAPSGTNLPDYCGGEGHAWAHSRTGKRFDLSIEYSCAPGMDNVQVQGYIVFGYMKASVEFSGMVSCPRESFEDELSYNMVHIGRPL